MPTVIPFVPQQITVHLGSPDSNAANVTVLFSDYIKNVASSEIYPTWDEAALRANIYAIVSFALHRVYTEFYRSRGYDSTMYPESWMSCLTIICADRGLWNRSQRNFATAPPSPVKA